MDPTAKLRIAASTLGLMSPGGVPLRAVGRLFRDHGGGHARAGLDGEVVPSASAVRIAARSSSASRHRRAANFPDYFAALCRTGFARKAVTRSTASAF
ncbi:MAG: hypothetical protein ABSG76_16395 [Xanthobacteraceae bacterium]|jgi:hypothetical protein